MKRWTKAAALFLALAVLLGLGAFAVSEAEAAELFAGRWTDKENGKYQRLGDYVDDATHRAAGAYCYWVGTLKRNNAEMRTLNACTQKMQADEREIATDYPFIIQILEAGSEYGTTLNQITKEAFANLIVCEDAELEGLYAEYVQRWEEEGGLEWEEEATKAYHEENPA